jgi:hypothetical protein
MMGKLAKLLVAAAAPLLLTGCLWGPGKFTSDLTLRKNGTFTLDYKGEILFQLPDGDKDISARPWSDAMALCHKNGMAELKAPAPFVSDNDKDNGAAAEERPCTAAENAKLRAEYEKQEAERIAKKREEADQMAKIFGLPGSDDASNRRFAATLMKYKGWRSVAYQGKGVFAVDYHADGSLAQDYAFPMIPDADLMLPFIAIRRRTDGAVLVTAPALTGGSGPFGARAKSMGLPDKGNDGPASKAQGRFIIVTDAEILTNNSEDGPAPNAGGRMLKWDVDAASAKVPEALIKL